MTVTPGLESSGERNTEHPCGTFKKKKRGKCRDKKSKYITWGMEKVRNVLCAREKEKGSDRIKENRKTKLYSLSWAGHSRKEKVNSGIVLNGGKINAQIVRLT